MRSTKICPKRKIRKPRINKKHIDEEKNKIIKKTIKDNTQRYSRK
jgi:hypothetical protein